MITPIDNGLSKTRLMQLRELLWIEQLFNVVLMGPSGTGKTFIAAGLCNDAIRKGYRAYFRTMEDIANMLKMKNITRSAEEAGDPIPVEKHKEIARKFTESGNSRKVLDEVIEDVVKDYPKSIYDPVKKLEGRISRLVESIKNFEESLKGIRYIYDRKIGIPVPWEDIEHYYTLIDKMSSILTDIQYFMDNHEKVAVVESEN